MNDDEELRKFLVSSITLDDLNAESRNLMFKRLISAYCQLSTSFELNEIEKKEKTNDLRRNLLRLKYLLVDASDDSWGRAMSYHEGGSDYYNPVTLGVKIAKIKNCYEIILKELNIFFLEDKKDG